MSHRIDERVRAGLTYEEDVLLLYEVSAKMAGVLHLEMCHPARSARRIVFLIEIVE